MNVRRLSGRGITAGVACALLFSCSGLVSYAVAHINNPEFSNGDNCGERTDGHEHRDVFRLDAGSDCASTFAGDDLIEGENGRDAPLGGGAGPDVIRGGNANDDLFGSDGSDDMNGGTYSDEVHGGDAGDDLTGGPGSDETDGIDGHIFDTVRGGDDNDFDVCDFDKRRDNGNGDEVHGCDAYNINYI